MLTCNVSSKNKKTLNLGPKIPYLGTFGCNLIKTIVKFLISTLEFVKLWSFIQNKKNKKKLRTKNALLGLWAGMFKNYCHISNQRPPICLIAKFNVKIRILKFGTKNALFGCLGVQFWKAIVLFVISALEFLVVKFGAETKILKFRTKNVYFGCFWTKIWKYYCHNLNQRPQICLIPKFNLKIKILNFGTKSALSGYFSTGIWKQYCHPRICLIAKFREKREMPIFLGPKMPYLDILRLEFEKNIVIFEISTLV